ncbi:MAG: universal stress protein [Sphaerochaetaceae bacterium]|jgi:nucleotide-binding universal stress UspA family protein|nr:universal stress protein [Sphaerochaetaceae bacterium]
MIEKVIVATDLSESSNILIKNLSGLAVLGVRKVMLLQCPSLQEVTSSAIPTAISYQTDALEQQREIIRKQGFEVDIKISPGSPKREINRIAEQDEYPLIVVGSRGESLIAGAFLGGVAHEVILNAKLPVLIVHLEISTEGVLHVVGSVDKELLDHVLFATDFSPASDEAFAYVKLLADSTQMKKVTLLHVQDQRRIEPYLSDRLGEFNSTDRGRLAMLKVDLAEKDVETIDIELRYGIPYMEILKAMSDLKPTLLVMGTQGRGFMRELFVGSVSQYVARRSWIPVILVPAIGKK